MRAQTDNWWDQCIDYDQGADSYHVASERSELASTNVVLSVAAIEETAPTSLPPLAATVDPEALDNLFVADVRGHVSFTYAGYEVTIYGDGRLEIVPDADVTRRQQRN